MDSALAAQQQRAATWQAQLQAEEARLSELAARLQVRETLNPQEIRILLQICTQKADGCA